MLNGELLNGRLLSMAKLLMVSEGEDEHAVLVRDPATSLWWNPETGWTADPHEFVPEAVSGVAGLLECLIEGIDSHGRVDLVVTVGGTASSVRPSHITGGEIYPLGDSIRTDAVLGIARGSQVLVGPDYPTTGAMRIGNGTSFIEGASVWIFDAEDWAAGHRTVEHALVTRRTDSSGRWRAVPLDPGSYVVFVFRGISHGPESFDVEVS
jgi:hypothetical protein